VDVQDPTQVRELLEQGANPDDSRAIRSPLVQAITSLRDGKLICNLAIVKTLLKYGADPNRPDPQIGTMPLLSAFDVGDLDCARAIKAAGGRPDGRDAGGHTILTSAVGAAVRSGDMRIIAVAIDWGININVRAGDGSTALHEAVRLDSVNAVGALLQHGAAPCLKNNIGQTPLDMALNLARDQALIAKLRYVTRCSS
jgi:ankyrin repeat protein